MSFLDTVFGDPCDKHIKKKLKPIVGKINSFEKELENLSDEDLKLKTSFLKEEIKSGKTLEDILPQAFAVVREASKRVLGMRHFDVQLIGAMVLNQGDIAEMKTGEGKTLVATLAVYLNALSGKGVHVVTVNDYLSRRDAVWMGRVYDFLGMSIGVIQHEKSFLYDGSVKIEESSDSKLRATPHDYLVSESLDNKKEIPNQVQDDDNASDAQDGELSPMVEIDYDHLNPVSRKEAYLADITYGTNNEFGFDYLRDNMASSLEQMVQRPFYFAIVDEVDSILIDEARTPLIISAPDNRPIDQYYKFAKLVKELKENEDYNVDEKMRAATLTEAGIKKMETWLGVENIYTEGGLEMAHQIDQALKASTLFEKDRDYVVKDGEVVIVDEFTGRLMFGRRYSEGLHQAIEAKEGVEIRKESRTLATITFQNYFRMYPKLSGMTGTAKTEEEEFRKIYNLEVYVIPTNKPVLRKDNEDKIYKSKQGKYNAVVNEIKERNRRGQPVLLGTISIEQNEEMSQILSKAGVKHEILNAKNHEREAEIIARAGEKGSVTLATNMAGRGVDIVLGGNPFDQQKAEEVKRLGGLHVIGTERHEARRIDNQLRGRSGRQGDPGSSRFFISVDDDLMRIFGSEKIKSMMTRLGIPDDMPIENKMVSRSIESAQKKVEGNNFDIRKHVVQYDDIMNAHREAIYSKRKSILSVGFDKNQETDQIHDLSKDFSQPENLEKKHISLGEMIFEMIEKEIEQVVNLHTASSSCEDWNLKEIEQTMATIFPVFDGEDGNVFDLKNFVLEQGEKDKGKDAMMRSSLIDFLFEKARTSYLKISEKIQTETVVSIEKAVLLNSIDTLWMDHLEALDNLRTAVGLRGYGQRDPLVEYKRDAYMLFIQLQSSIQNQVVYSIFKILASQAPSFVSSPDSNSRIVLEGGGISNIKGMRFLAPSKTSLQENESLQPRSRDFSGSAVTAISSLETKPKNRFDGKKVGRNDLCPCGSGKKYKRCHGA